MEYKYKKIGSTFEEADMWFPSSKLCSQCGRIKGDLKLSDRVYRCECGLVMDRDENSSINLSRYDSDLVA